jgi:type I restriction enzyme, S subunit
VAIHDDMRNSQLKTGDILINITGASIGRTCMVPIDLGIANINQHIAFLRIKSWFNTSYISLFLKSPFAKNHIQLEQNGASKEAFNLSQIANIPLVLPPLPEQKAIAYYLDTKTAQIDRKIDLLTQKATLYGKLKQSLINETVTQGLDKTVPMKDSGIEWIGDVPEHWEKGRIKNFTESNTMVKTPIHLNHIDLVEFIPMTNINEKLGKIKEFNLVPLNEVSSGYTKFRNGDVIFAKITPCMENGNVALVSELKHNVGFGSTEFMVFRPCKKLLAKYLHYFLHNALFRKNAEYFMKGTAGQKRITSLYMAIHYFGLPPLPEQKAIADYLDTKTAQIDQIIQTINTQIEKLKELRKTLINDVVTGKIKVIGNEQ